MSQSYKKHKNNYFSICDQCLECCNTSYFLGFFTFFLACFETMRKHKTNQQTHTHLHIGTNKTGIHVKENLTVWLNPSRNYLKYISLSSAWLILKEYLGQTLKRSETWGTERKTGHQTFFFKSKLSLLATNQNLCDKAFINIIESFLD